MNNENKNTKPSADSIKNRIDDLRVKHDRAFEHGSVSTAPYSQQISELQKILKELYGEDY